MITICFTYISAFLQQSINVLQILQFSLAVADFLIGSVRPLSSYLPFKKK